MKEIILASTSPRRHDLLNQIGLKFKIVPSNYEEDMTLKLPPHKLAMFLAKGKASDVAERRKSGIVIGVDTFVVFNKEVIGKPHNKVKAKETLKKISGKTLKVYSGVAIIDAKTKKEIVDYEISKVKIRKITTLEIKKYIDTEEPLDKAGAFGMQGLGAIFVAKVDGCYSNVVGLPLHNLEKNLAKMGIDVFSYQE
ncbi:septum formation inhibitor Maf [Candidatus Woesearchaeota archaeon]|jgi:septum formation protein|nr:septum formation inhibitor Maf [Candidatus Woesearchaeota archaeon]MBT4110666.1 septum formation inhibitor Maf [Candidatus Woesearchaeota archaeon]MBT4336262.1 septum formation inhibitor Maf [Candidatus Woesearchaeota archaeon]MBT4469377.1 septum formation inhibitor Maf [Candidatus Woesearchaeota archaeon]MBT6743800.1 septum formation inhibitor Maf [Candidatus Woesearchaeota archaeon]